MKVNPWKDQVALYFLSTSIIEVDDEGRIWKLKDGRGRPYKWRDIKPIKVGSINASGYLAVSLQLNGKTYKAYAHRISYLAHIGLIDKQLQINHKNGIKDDNKPSNLEMVTQEINQRHSYKVLGRQNVCGERHWNSKLRENDIRTIRDKHKTGCISYKELGYYYDVSYHTIRGIVRREQWRHII